MSSFLKESYKRCILQSLHYLYRGGKKETSVALLIAPRTNPRVSKVVNPQLLVDKGCLCLVGKHGLDRWTKEVEGAQR